MLVVSSSIHLSFLVKHVRASVCQRIAAAPADDYSRTDRLENRGTSGREEGEKERKTRQSENGGDERIEDNHRRGVNSEPTAAADSLEERRHSLEDSPKIASAVPLLGSVHGNGKRTILE